MEQLASTFEKPQDNFQLKRFANLIISKWYWVLGFLFLSLGVAYLIIRYESPVYVVQASFLTKKFDNRNTNPLSQLTGTGGSFVGQIDVSQEIPLLKSQDRIQATLNLLDFDISYFLQGKFKTSEIYPGDFYQVIVDSTSRVNPYNIPIYLKVESDSDYALYTENVEWQNQFQDKKFRFGETVQLAGWKFRIETNEKVLGNGANEHFFTVNRPYDLVMNYRNSLRIVWQSGGTSILNASIATSLPEKDYDFLNAYFKVIVQKGLEEKSQSITNTISFINDYLPQISDTLATYQKRLDNFKLQNRELVNGSSFVFEKLEELEEQKVELIVSDKYYDYLTDYIKQHKDKDVFAPPLIGVQAPLNDLIDEYLELRWDQGISRNAENIKNPLVSRNSQFERFERNMFEGISNLKLVNKQEMFAINQKIDFYYSTIDDLQVESREFYELERMVTLYENVFFNLITRRTEAFLSQASIVSDYQVVSHPGFNKNNPISPDKEKLIIIALFIGLGVPLGVLYLLSISGNKVVSKNDLLANTDIPLLGYVGHSPELDNLVVYNSPKSLVAESFRRIRANLQYYNNGNSKHVLLITSSISAEGKTFCSTNLAFTYALAGKKTIIVGADMRKPTLAKSFDLSKEKGLSNYLAGQCPIDEAIYPTGNDNLQIIPGGSIPPNPAELILTDRMKKLMTHLKKHYDLVIIDTPPIGLVADAIELMDHSDLNLLIVRQNVTFKKSLHETTENYQKGQLKNMTILFNDVDFQKLEYGYKAYIEGYHSYGYGYNSGYFDDDATSTK